MAVAAIRALVMGWLQFPCADGMTNWESAVETIRADLAAGRIGEATHRVTEALQRFPEQLWIHTAASDVYRAAGQHHTALLYAEHLMRLAPQSVHGWCRSAEDLVRLGRLEQAEARIAEGLRLFPREYWILIVAGEVYRELDQLEQALQCAVWLIEAHPQQCTGYARAAEDLVALKRFDQAMAVVQEGLAQATEHQQLQRLAAYVGRFVGMRPSEHSLEGASRTALPLRDVVAYADVPGFFSAMQAQRTQLASGPGASDGVGKNILFVAGLGRSGTSALGKLLNIAAPIELYTELHDPGRLNGYEPEDFLEPRLSAALARHRQPGDQELYAQKHGQSLWIGDKRPNLQFCLESSYDNFVLQHQVCTLFIQRDLRAVLRSTHKRSEDPRDQSWSREHGMEFTVLLYNATCHQLIDLHERRPDLFDTILFVRYDEVFSDPACSERIFQHLGVVLSVAEREQLEAFVAASVQRQQRSHKPDDLDARIDAVITRYLDQEAEQKLAGLIR